MADFLKIDLDQHNQPATARLRDDVTTITQAYFDKSGVTITRFGIDKKPRSFYLTAEELSYLCGFAGEYDARVMQHTVTIAERKEAAIVEAKALAKSVQFDLPDLNVRAKRDGDQWHVVVRAIGVEHYTTTENLKGTVQDLLNRIRHEVESAECYYNDLSDEWKQIVASYRRVFPLVSPEQGEPAELSPEAISAIQDLSAALKEANENYVDPEGLIAQARELLNGSAHPEGWSLEHIGVSHSEDRYSFDNGLDGEKHISFLNHPANTMFNLINAYLIDNNIPRSASEQAALQDEQGDQLVADLLKQVSEPSRSA